MQRRSLGRVKAYLLGALVQRNFLLSSYLKVRIHKWRGVYFVDEKTAFIGDNVYLDSLNPAGIKLGKYVRITANVRILTHYIDANYQSSNPKQPFRYTFGNVSIGDNVFIGSNTVIAKPVTIGNNVVIAAGSVVISDLPANTICGGNPAKVLKERKSG